MLFSDYDEKRSFMTSMKNLAVLYYNYRVNYQKRNTTHENTSKLIGLVLALIVVILAIFW